MDSGKRVRALRGATTVTEDTAEAIVDGTVELLTEVLERNDVDLDDLVSLVFTATPDLTAEFPAAAARKLGISDVPLLCAQEIGVADTVPRCIRVLVHLYTDLGRDRLRHPYLRGAKALRTDLPDN